MTTIMTYEQFANQNLNEGVLGYYFHRYKFWALNGLMIGLFVYSLTNPCGSGDCGAKEGDAVVLTQNQDIFKIKDTVIVYGRNSCGRCTRLKKELDELNIPYIDVKTGSNDAVDKVAHSIGLDILPMAIINGKVYGNGKLNGDMSVDEILKGITNDIGKTYHVSEKDLECKGNSCKVKK